MAMSNQKLIYFEKKFVKDLFANSDKSVYYYLKN